jgi:hypothetical protein
VTYQLNRLDFCLDDFFLCLALLLLLSPSCLLCLLLLELLSCRCLFFRFLLLLPACVGVRGGEGGGLQHEAASPDLGLLGPAAPRYT